MDSFKKAQQSAQKQVSVRERVNQQKQEFRNTGEYPTSKGMFLIFIKFGFQIALHSHMRKYRVLCCFYIKHEY